MLDGSAEGLLVLKPTRLYLIPVGIMLLLLVALIIAATLEAYDIKLIKARVSCDETVCGLTANILLDEIELVAKGEYLVINKEKLGYSVISIGDIEVDYGNLISYQEVLLKIDLPPLYRKNNLVVDGYLYTNKEKLIKKVFNVFKGVM